LTNTDIISSGTKSPELIYDIADLPISLFEAIVSFSIFEVLTFTKPNFLDISPQTELLPEPGGPKTKILYDLFGAFDLIL